MVNKPNIKHNALFMASGNAVFALCQIINVMVLSHLGGPEQVGVFAQGLALAAPVMIFCNFGLRTLLATDASREFAFNHYTRLRSYTSAIGLVIIILSALIVAKDTVSIYVAVLIGLAKTAENQSDLYYGAFQQCEKHRYIAASLLLRGSVGTCGLALTYWLTRDIVYATMGYALCWTIMYYAYDKRLSSNLALPNEQSPSWAVIKKLLKLGLPLAISAMVVNLNVNAPRILIGHELGLEQLGVYASIFYIISVGALAMNSIGQVINARLARFFVEYRIKLFVQYVLGAVGLALLCSLCLVVISYVLGEWLLTLLFGPELASYKHILLMMAAGSACIYINSILNYVTSSTRHNQWLMIIQCVMGGVIITAVILLPTDLGLARYIVAVIAGAAAGNVSYIVVLAYLLKRHLKQAPKMP